MWLDRIIEAKKAQGITTKQMAERIKRFPEETIRRILSGKTKTPRVDTILDLGAAVGLSPYEIFAETSTYLGDETFKTLQAELDTIKAERDALATENKELRDKVVSLSHENEILKIKLDFAEKLIETHEYYINSKGVN